MENSSKFKFTWIDSAIFVAMLAISSVVGLYFGYKDYRARKSKSAEDTQTLEYLVGNRQMHAYPVGLSLIATWISALALLGTTSEVYVFGYEYVYILTGTLVLGLVMHFIFLPVYYDLKITSLHVYLQRRFDKKVQLLGSLMFTTQLVLWMPPVIYSPAVALNTVTGFDELKVSIVLVAICVFYTFLGGIKAVIWTDVFQITATFAVFVCIAVFGTLQVGGLDVVYARNLAGERFTTPSFSSDPTIRHTLPALVIGGSFFWMATNCGNQNMIQRYLSLPDLRSTRTALWIYVAGVVCFIGMSCYLGLLIYAYYETCDPITTGLAKSRDALLPLFVTDLFGSYDGFTGFFVAGLFASSLSSLSTGLNALSAVIVEDFVKVLIKRKITTFELQLWMRGVVIVFGVVSVLLILVVRQIDGIMQLAMSISSCTLGPLLGIFVLGLIFPWVGSRSAFFAGLLSFVITLANGIRTQLAIINRKVVFLPKPVSVVGCSEAWANATTPNPVDYYISGEHLSYIYYGMFGVLSCCLLGNFFVLIFGKNNTKLLSPGLVAPFMRKSLT